MKILGKLIFKVTPKVDPMHLNPQIKNNFKFQVFGIFVISWST